MFSDILNHIKKLNPDVKFLLENVVMKKFLLILLMIVIGIVGLVLFERAVYLLSIIDRITQTVSLALLIISLPAVIVTAIYLIVKINEIIQPQ